MREKTDQKDSGSVPASFRDPSGFLFREGGVLYRQVNEVYREHYDRLIESGLYDALAGDGLLIPHEDVTGKVEPRDHSAHKIIKPEPVPFISYPYCWCFSQLKDAALATLKIQRRALDAGMSLKDSSAFNMQFMEGRPVFIDTLSFESYREGRPWVAYRQFCQHFLAPLALMSRRDIRLSHLLSTYIDGVPLDLASRLLPPSTRLRFSLLTHIHMHARSQRRYEGKAIDPTKLKVSRVALNGLIDSLESAIRGLRWKPVGTEWEGYYDDTNYSARALEHKKEIVGGYLSRISPGQVWDLGANTGIFSRIAGDMGMQTISFDKDPAAVERNYLDCRREGERNILPLVMDFTNPSAGNGWASRERMSLSERGPADAAMALALVHHLAIANNVPFQMIADYLSEISRWLIVEFVPKSDSQVKRLLASREDIFSDYTKAAFEREFGRRFEVQDSWDIAESQRTVYLMRRISA